MMKEDIYKTLEYYYEGRKSTISHTTEGRKSTISHTTRLRH